MHGVMPDATADQLHEVLHAAEADVVVVGHTHRAMELRLGDRLVLNPGALLRDPADGWERELPTPGTFGVLELPEKRWTVFRARTGGAVEIRAGGKVATCSWAGGPGVLRFSKHQDRRREPALRSLANLP